MLIFTHIWFMSCERFLACQPAVLVSPLVLKPNLSISSGQRLLLVVFGISSSPHTQSNKPKERVASLGFGECLPVCYLMAFTLDRFSEMM